MSDMIRAIGQNFVSVAATIGFAVLIVCAVIHKHNGSNSNSNGSGGSSTNDTQQ